MIFARRQGLRHIRLGALLLLTSLLIGSISSAQDDTVSLADPGEATTPVDSDELAGSADLVALDEPADVSVDLGEDDDDGQDMVTATADDTFMVNFQNTDVRLALRLLSTQGRRNIVASKSVTGTVTATFYDVTFQEALDAILQATGYVQLVADNFIYIYTADELTKVEQAGREMEVRSFQLHYAQAADAQILIMPALSGEGAIAVSPASERGIAPNTDETGGGSFAMGDMLVIRDYPENLDAAAALLAEIDRRPQQVLIEATILTARLDETNALGINFTALNGIDFADIGSRSTGVGNMSTGSVASGATGHSSGAALRTDFDIVEGGMSIGILTGNIAAFISALEDITDITVLANPKLLVLNKQRGEVLIGSRDGYRTTVVSDGVSTEEVEFLETGTKLLVRPFVGEGGFIRLEIHPEDSDGSIVDGLPSETTTQVTSNVMVQDGRAIVVGGLFREEVQQERSQIPVLGNVKYIGPLFGQTEDTTERREVIIILRPRIIQDDNDHAVSEH